MMSSQRSKKDNSQVRGDSFSLENHYNNMKTRTKTILAILGVFLLGALVMGASLTSDQVASAIFNETDSSINVTIQSGVYSGAMTIGGDLTLENGEIIENGTDGTVGVQTVTALTSTIDDLLNLQHTTTGSPANGIGVGVTATVETTAGNEVVGSMDFVVTDVDSASEDADFVLSMMDGGAAAAERWRTDSGGIVTQSAVSAATNAVVDVMNIKHNTSGTEANGIGLGILFTQEVTSGDEVAASIDVSASDVTGASEDFSYIVSLMAGGSAASPVWTLGSTGIATLVGGATLDNATSGTVLNITETTVNVTGNITTSGSVDIVGAGGLIMSNDETITNAVNGAVVVDGSFDITAAGGLILSNDETITNATNGTIAADGIVQAPDFALQDETEASGALTLHSVTANSGALTGATDKIEVNIPDASLLVACSLRVDVAVTNAGDNTWAAAYSGGATAAIAGAGAAAAKNTKVNTFFDANAATAIANAETDITLTPQGADFTAGDIAAVCYYYALTTLDDFP